MSTQVQSGTWTEDGSNLLSQPLLNFFARRRIAISLIGFVTLLLINLFVRRAVPLNPFSLGDPRVPLALGLLLTGLLIRTWAAGSLNKSREVTQHGPYAITRNPLYIGSFLVMFAFCILLRDLPTFLFVAGPMTFLYWLQVRFEEKRLLFLFPQAWPEYARRVPRFIPCRLSREALEGWSRFEWKRNREYKACLASAFGVLGVYIWHLISQRIW